MPLKIIRNDITKVHADAIVNAANSALQEGGGVCGAIFAAAGREKLQQACDEIGGCEIGQAVLTEGFNLQAKYIIHTVGPVWHGGKQGEEKLLADCYKNSLALARENKLESIAFPLISSGIYRFPKDKALTIAFAEIGSFLIENDMAVFLVVFDQETFDLAQKLYYQGGPVC
jgi:O-acetyl-ADP-ribose deacetylase (regulator of RNase III)